MISSSLDQEFLDELLDGDREFGEELLQAFEEASERWLGEADEACRDGLQEQAVRAFHTLKGSAASVGLTDLRELSRDLESLAKAGQLRACAGRLFELEALVKQGRQLFFSFLETI